MSKCILVMDMPKNCWECKFSDLDCERCICRFRMIPNHATKPSWCPLKEVPDKKRSCEQDSLFDYKFKKGYNACIDKILGGCDD